MKSKKKDTKVQCKICNMTFSHPRSLRNHMACHSHEKFQCMLCYKYYGSKENLNVHVRRIHSERSQLKKLEKEKLKTAITPVKKIYGAKKFLCSVCGKKYSRLGAINCHFESTHIRLTKYPCLECGSIFYSEQKLLRHKKKHTDPILTCDLCDYKSHSKFELKSHKGIHNKVSCHVCGKLVANLRVHLQIHAQVKCELCNRYFPINRIEKHTENIHTPVSCSLCNKCCSDSLQLTR